MFFSLWRSFFSSSVGLNPKKWKCLPGATISYQQDLFPKNIFPTKAGLDSPQQAIYRNIFSRYLYLKNTLLFRGLYYKTYNGRNLRIFVIS